LKNDFLRNNAFVTINVWHNEPCRERRFRDKQAVSVPAWFLNSSLVGVEEIINVSVIVRQQ